VWAAHQIDPTSPRYNCGVVIELDGPIDEALMCSAVQAALHDAEALRVRFHDAGQSVRPVAPDACELLDTLRAADPRAAAERWMQEDLGRPIDLESGDLVRHVLIKIGEHSRLLYLRHHHVVLDGFGAGIHLRRIIDVYAALASGRQPSPAQAAPLSTLIAEDGEYTASAAHAADAAYWRGRLAGGLTTVSPSGLAPAAGPAARVQRRTATLSAETAALLEEVSDRLDTTPSAMLIAAVAAYVARVNGREDTLLNLPLSTRTSKAARGTPCMLANQLPLRVQAARASTFAELVSMVTARLVEAHRHQRYRGEELHQELGLFGTGAQLGAPTVNILVGMSRWKAPGITGSLHLLSAGPVRDLSLTFLMDRGGSDVGLVLEADAARYTTAALASHEERLLTLIEEAVRSPSRTVGSLPVMSADERAAVLDAGAGRAADYDSSVCLHDLVEAQARRTPDAVAVQIGDDVLTYVELVARSRRLAAHLRTLGAGPGRIVAVHEERSLNLVIDLLAVLMSGAAYLPLDPDLPRQRVAFQIEDAGVSVVLSRSDLAMRLAGPDVAASIVAVDLILDGLPDVEPRPREAAPTDIAYVIYTSGSTGWPKGVAVPHRGIVNRLLWMQEEYGLDADDRVLQKTAFTFDVSVWELFWPLIVGARLHLAEPGAHRDPRALAEIIRRRRITTLHFVPTMLDLFLHEPSSSALDSVKRVFASGEALNPETVGRFFALFGSGDGLARGDAAPALYNLYGPTEASVDVTAWTCRLKDSYGVVPIGRAVANTTIRVLDSAGELVPFGVAGELCIGGVQVAAGYVNRPELTAERFVDNPFGEGKLYRTGDSASLRRDGVLEYLGRLDDQVKVRGFRIELGEIEAALLSHPSVGQAVAVARKHPDGQPRIVAYVVPAREGVDTRELLTLLRERLPEYMIPAHVLVQDSLPRLSSGKVDRGALPDPEIRPSAGPTEVVAPATDAERLVQEVWSSVLGRDVVDVCTSFFALGGDSILSIKMRSALERRGFTFAIQDFFQAPTARGLAGRLRPRGLDQASPRVVPFSLLRSEDVEALPEDVEDAYPLTRLQTSMIFHAGYGDGTAMYRVVLSGHVMLPFDEGVLRRALSVLFRRHPILRTSLHLTGFGEPLQMVHREVPIPLEVSRELLGLDAAEQEARLRAWVASAKYRDFDVTVAPLVAFTVHERGAGSFQLDVVEHHAVLDGLSDVSMLREIVLTYEAALSGAELRLPNVPSTYHGFVAAERRALQSEEHRAFWQRELDGFQSTLLPRTSSVRRAERADHRAYDIMVDGSVATRIAGAARRAQLPFKSLLVAAHVAVLRAVCASDSVHTGVISHARLDEEGGDQVLGLFLNTLPLRVDVGDASWLDLARQVHAHEGRTAPYRSYPYAQIVQDHPGLSLDSYVNFVNFYFLGDETEMRTGFGTAETEFALAALFGGDPASGRLTLSLDFDLAVLSESLCHRLLGYYRRALRAIADDADSAVRSIDLREEDEVQLLRRGNDTRRAYDADATVHGLIARQVRATPDAFAVLSGERRLTYAELDARAGRLARHLRAHGALPGARVGVHVRRSADLVVALVAVLQTGAAYVPLDPDFPPERLRYIARDASLSCLVTVATLDGLDAGAVISLSADAGRIAQCSAAAIDDARRSEDPAYVMYTSGSTGHPKGTVLRHRNVVNFFAGMDDRIGVGARDTVLALTSISFDISVLELLWPLTRGAAVLVAPERMIETLVPAPGTDQASFVELCSRHQPTLLQATPSFLAAVACHPEAWSALSGLRTLLVGGEAFPAGLARQLVTALPSVRIFNMYGPTETTIWSSVHELDRRRDVDADVVPIGRPIANTQLRITAPHGAEVPVGVAGELWIGGDGVAVGYFGKPDLTAERFVSDPDGKAERWYRTGDRARWRDDGVVEFLGRMDRQIKVAGHRIELDEVEGVLSRHPEVGAVAVIAVPSASGGTELLAYLAPSTAGADVNGQRAHVDRWGEVWDMAYSDPSAEAGARDGDVEDFAGWRSSYTGEPIPPDEMRAWVRHTVERCAALGARRVVDVGVGVGLLLRELAPRAESYLGLDVSEAALRLSERAVRGARYSSVVSLERGDAFKLAELPDGSADLVVFNSVIQYFPGADYFRSALREALRVVGPAGAVFVGDVRDLALLDAFHAHVQIHRAPALMDASAVAVAAERARGEERELCIARDFFTDFAAREPAVGDVRFELKRGRAANELTRFRFDVTLLGKDRAKEEPADGPRLAWAGEATWGAIASLVASTPPDVPILLSDVPNRRMVQPLAAARLLRDDAAQRGTAWNLQRLLWEHDGPHAVDPEDLAALAERHARAATLLPAKSGAIGNFDVVLTPTEHGAR